MDIRNATLADIDWLERHDHHISAAMLPKKIRDEEIYVAVEQENVGWLRYGLFWDSMPFMNLRSIFIEGSAMSILAAFSCRKNFWK